MSARCGMELCPNWTGDGAVCWRNEFDDCQPQAGNVVVEGDEYEQYGSPPQPPAPPLDPSAGYGARAGQPYGYA